MMIGSRALVSVSTLPRLTTGDRKSQSESEAAAQRPRGRLHKSSGKEGARIKMWE